VGLVVFLFMGSFRTVIVPLLAMPVSIVGACVFMMLMGFSLNLLTILAIVLNIYHALNTVRVDEVDSLKD
jgi:multidrug efflux pump subunit AcrB